MQVLSGVVLEDRGIVPTCECVGMGLVGSFWICSEGDPAFHESGLEISDDGSTFMLARAMLWSCLVFDRIALPRCPVGIAVVSSVHCVDSMTPTIMAHVTIKPILVFTFNLQLCILCENNWGVYDTLYALDLGTELTGHPFVQA